MTPAQINAAIATWMGWTQVGALLGKLWGVPGDGGELQLVPNYHGDLNACHSFEDEKVEPWEMEAYATKLVQVVGAYYQSIGKNPSAFSTTAWFYACAHATAPQRSEAILRVLNLWKE